MRYLFEVDKDLWDKFKARCGLTAMSKVMSKLIKMFIDGKVELED